MISSIMVSNKEGLSAINVITAAVPAIRYKPRRSTKGQHRPGAFHCCPAARGRQYLVAAATVQLIKYVSHRLAIHWALQIYTAINQ
jgi:hypothetical protein